MARRRRYDDYGWGVYVPVAERRAQARNEVKKLRKKGRDIQPVEIEGRLIAKTFWGRGWCDHMESFRDYSNRLPRGRTYVRNGSVCHLAIAPGRVDAIVSGSELYKVTVTIEPLPAKKWGGVKKRCAGQIGSLLELLQGKLSANVMTVVTDRKEGLFPLSGEISVKCECPDWAVMCKHVAAVLYGVGARLDERPELLFLLRGVDHEELIAADVDLAVGASGGKRRRIAADALAGVFGIEMSEDAPLAKAKPARRKKKTTKKAAPKSKRKTSAKPRTPAKAAGKKPKTSAPAPDEITGESVARLRAKFGMTQGQFAQLLGVSDACISNWEKKPGILGLQVRTYRAVRSVEGLTKRQAQRRLGRL